MARDLNEAWGWIQRLIARVSRLESGAMLENSSITNGRMRFIGGLLRVDSGGRVDIEGTLKGLGSLLWDGIVTFTSTFTAKGTTRFEGDTTQVGPLGLEGTMTVKAGGKVIVQGPSAATLENGALSFATGGKVVAYPSGAAVSAGSAQVVASTAGAYLFFGTANISVASGFAGISAPAVSISAANLTLSSLPTVSAAGKTPNIWMDGSGKLWRLI